MDVVSVVWCFVLVCGWVDLGRKGWVESGCNGQFSVGWDCE